MIGIVSAVAALGVAFLCFYQPSQSQPTPDSTRDKEKRTIHTSGSATVKVKPDSARVFFGVQTMAGAIKAAREENGAKVKKVMDGLAALKIPDLKMKTSDVRVEIVQSHRREDHMPEILGYRITNYFTVLVQNDDAEKLSMTAGRVLDTALECGANLVQQIVFFKQDLTETKRQALAKAVEDAAANARALAAGGKVTVHDTIQINGQPEFYYPRGYPMGNTAQVAFGAGGEDTPLVAGDLEITCQVSVTCTY
jgi:hypothetical protein